MTRSQKTFLTLAVSLLLAFLFLALAIFPLLKAIAGTTQRLQSEEQKFSGLEASQKALEDFRRFKASKEEEFLKFNDFLVDTENPSQFFAFLENLASRQGFSLRIIPQEPATVAGDLWPSIDFQISSRSTFPQLYAFLEKLEAGPYLLSIRNLQATEKEGVVEFSLFFKAYGK